MVSSKCSTLCFIPAKIKAPHVVQSELVTKQLSKSKYQHKADITASTLVYYKYVELQQVISMKI